MGSLARIGHVGVYTKNLASMRRFYHEILGLIITDEVEGTGPIFLSARPDVEHHELVLLPGRDPTSDTMVIQQLSFRCNQMDDVIDFYRRLKQDKTKFDFVVSHGNAVSVYCFDPDGNRCEIYWDTGLKAKQPYIEAINLSRPAAELMEEIKASVAKHGGTGHVDWDSVDIQRKSFEMEGQA